MIFTLDYDINYENHTINIVPSTRGGVPYHYIYANFSVRLGAGAKLITAPRAIIAQLMEIPGLESMLRGRLVQVIKDNESKVSEGLGTQTYGNGQRMNPYATLYIQTRNRRISLCLTFTSIPTLEDLYNIIDETHIRW